MLKIVLAARDRPRRRRISSARADRRPGVEQRERTRIERRAGRVQADRIVDADEERLASRAPPAAGALRACEVAAWLSRDLGGEQRRSRSRRSAAPARRVRSAPPAHDRVVASFACCARSSRIVVVGADSRPSHITALRKRRLVAGSGRRYMRCRRERRAACTDRRRCRRRTPRRRARRCRRESVPCVSSRLKAARFRPVETSAPSQLDPSLVRKIGSVPRVAAKRSGGARASRSSRPPVDDT